MFGPITWEHLGYAVGIGGMLFAAYKHFKGPAEKTINRLAILEQKFIGEQKIIEQLSNLRDNHLHTIESKLDSHITRYEVDQKNTGEQLVRITTILDERLPKKN